MKLPHILALVAFALLTLIVALAIINFNPPLSPLQDAVAGSIKYQQVSTPTPVVPPASEVGSTDGILIMGFVITLIIVLPLLFNRRK